MKLGLIVLPLIFLSPLQVVGETLNLTSTTTTEWKAVYGRIEARDRVPARVRIGGTVVALNVTEGDVVSEGELIATVIDDKLTFQLSALEARKGAQAAQLANAETELARGEQLLKQGVSTVQRLDGLRTQVEVLKGQIASIEAEIELIRQTQDEGRVLAPAGGRVLDVPVSTGAVVMPGEPVALISVGGIFLRLAVPERHAAMLQEGAEIRIEGVAGVQSGRLIKVYPLIENGRVIADVDVQGAPDRFVDARVLVRLPMQEREALFVPVSALISNSGLDFVQVETDAGPTLRSVVPGQRSKTDQGEVVEILTGLSAGDRIVTDPVAGAGHE